MCLIPLVFSLLSMGASTAKAIAQTTFLFDVVYDFGIYVIGIGLMLRRRGWL
ncbi:MAG: hypothetical protein V7K80_04245 [Nostoc sp.]